MSKYDEEAKKGLEEELEQDDKVFKTVLEMVLLIMKSSKDLDDAIAKIESLDIMKR